MRMLNRDILSFAVKNSNIEFVGTDIVLSGGLTSRVGSALQLSSEDLARWDRTIPIAAVKPELVKVLFQAQAQIKIQKKYREVGAFKSPLGLALQPEVLFENGTFYVPFRGGKIEVKGLSPLDTEGQTIATSLRNCEIWLVAIKCHKEQEGAGVFIHSPVPDEIFGSILTFTPASGATRSQKFPSNTQYLDMGQSPDGNFVRLQELVWSGPPADVVITSVLVEQDSGDTDEFKRKIAEEAIKLGSAIIGGGPDVEKATKDDSFLNDVTLGLVNIVVDLFGANDDPYTPQSFRIDWNDFTTANFVQKDIAGVLYHKSMVLTGVDDGGDIGKYEVFFEIKIDDIGRVL